MTNNNSIIFKDRDFILTKDDFFFCVIGYNHPENRAISYLKYSPIENGKWKLNNKGLKRMLPHYSAVSVKDTLKFLKNYPEYIFEDKINNINISAVPSNLIEKYYSTNDKVRELLNKKSKDLLQKKTLELIQYLSRGNKLDFNNFGITGSILTDIHNPSFSDIDLTVIGQENSRIMKTKVKEEFDRKEEIIQFLNRSQINEWIDRKSKQYNMDQEIAKKIAQRMWNFGYFNKTRFSVHPIRSKDEIINNYGLEKYIYVDLIKIRAEVKDISESMFLPAKYGIDNVEVLNGKKIDDLKQIISYEGLYCDILLKDEKIEAFGKLEKVINLKNTNKTYHRLVIGTFEANSRDYLINEN